MIKSQKFQINLILISFFFSILLALSSLLGRLSIAFHHGIFSLLLHHFGHVTTTSSLEYVKATQILCDNRSSIAIPKNPTMHNHTKHIHIRFHSIRSLISHGFIILKHCSTEEEATYIFTKALQIQKHTYFISLLGVSSFQLRRCVEDN